MLLSLGLCNNLTKPATIPGTISTVLVTSPNGGVLGFVYQITNVQCFLVGLFSPTGYRYAASIRILQRNVHLFQFVLCDCIWGPYNEEAFSASQMFSWLVEVGVISV